MLSPLSLKAIFANFAGYDNVVALVFFYCYNHAKDVKLVFSECYAVALFYFCQNGKNSCHVDNSMSAGNLIFSRTVETKCQSESYRKDESYIAALGTDFAGLSLVMV